MFPSRPPAVLLCSWLLAVGCAGGPLGDDELVAAVVRGDPRDVPLAGLPADQRALFDAGDQRFEARFFPAQGLGPLYIRTSCQACHDDDGKGPGFVNKAVLVEPDGTSTPPPLGTTIRPFGVDGATPLLPPDGALVTTRIGPALFGRGALEAVRDDEIERIAAEQGARDDGISGRVHRVRYASERNSDERFHQRAPGDVVVGRFGLKARVAGLDDFAADALQGDMGITSPLRPAELANPDGAVDDARPGVDVDEDAVNALAWYTRLLALPARGPAADDEDARAAFAAARCDVCHVPALRTRADWPIDAWRDVDAPLFTDVLLHDMGEALADHVEDGDATGSEWRTAPLIGLRWSTSFLHDGRAASVEEAIRLHAGEAADSAARFAALDDDTRARLLAFVAAL